MKKCMRISKRSYYRKNIASNIYKINVINCFISPNLRLKMANLSDLKGFALQFVVLLRNELKSKKDSLTSQPNGLTTH